MRSKNTKPSVLILFSFIALAMSGCGKSNNSSAVIPPGVIAGQYGAPGSYTGGALSGVVATSPGMNVYMDSANIMQSPGVSGMCPGVENFMAAPLTGQSQDGYVTITGIRQNCQAQIQISIRLSAIVAQDIMYKMAQSGYGGGYGGGPYGGGAQPTINSAVITQVNIGRYGNTVYGGGIPAPLGKAAFMILVNGNFPYYLYF